ncbi:ELKS/Rab6-interacting/CAST family member 1-like [Engraulis encrasicolus]|uniref:ELKS/Rab6-interacting/CAST family member 1-like n=1 Tax=Engraulis encrasicolus TaxID=184585 RepID=UPI002FD3B23E
MYNSGRSGSALDGNHTGATNNNTNSSPGGGGVGGQGVGGQSQSPGRSPRLPRSPRQGHRRTNSSGSGAGMGPPGGAKTLSMENIQSLNAAYAASGPLYMSDPHAHTHAHTHAHMGGYSHTHPDSVVSSSGVSGDLPKSSMTLGRSGVGMGIGGGVGGRLVGSYGNRAGMGSNPNISGMGSDSIAFGGGDIIHTPPSSHTPPSGGSTVPHSLRQVRDNSFMDLQAQLKELLQENDILRKEVEAKEGKLASSMSSIKTFWSPELKKERALRKEEMGKMAVWKEQYRVMQDEAQHFQMTIQALQDELRIQRDLNQLFQQDGGVSGPGSSSSATGADLSEEGLRMLQGERERQAKELFLLRKTAEEMEMRIETQKQTLSARDHSIKKLLEMLQTRAPPSARASEEDQERTRLLAEAHATQHHLQALLQQKDKETVALREEMQRRYDGTPESAKTKALQTVIEMKDSKISSLERSLRDAEEEVAALKSNGALSSEERQEEVKQMEVYRSHSKFMKNKVEQLKADLCESETQGEELRKRLAELQQETPAIDQVKADLSRKDSELLGLQTKLETLNNQFSDSKQHVDVLKESLTAKEQRAAILQTEVDALRLRLEEKEAGLSKKANQLAELAEEKGTLGGEIHDLKDMLEVKERKVTVQQKKIDNLLEQLHDKEKQLSSLKDRVKSLQTDTSNTDTALTTLEEALAEKERIIDRLKEQRERDDREKTEELDSNRKELKDLKEKLTQLQGDFSDRETNLLDLKEHASSLASGGLKKDSKIKTLEISLEQKKEECVQLENQLKKAQSVAAEASSSRELRERVESLEQEVTRHKEEYGKAQAETERLLEILREVENEKNDKDKKMADMEKQMKEQGKKVANLKHKEQVEKSKNAQLMEEARKREEGMTDTQQQVKDSLRQKDERIEELEEALRESVQITAEREMVLAQEENARTHAEKQMEELMCAMDKVKQELDAMRMKLSSTQQSLSDKEAHLTTLRAERRKHLEEVLEMKQEALLAAISEKDANIALLELSSSKKKKTQDEVAMLKREKDRLVQQLKQQTQNRMKMMADNYEDDPLMKASSPAQETNHKPSPDQLIVPLSEQYENRSKLQLYIGHLMALCQERDPAILQELAPPPAYHTSQPQHWEEELHKMSTEKVNR